LIDWEGGGLLMARLETRLDSLDEIVGSKLPRLPSIPSNIKQQPSLNLRILG